MKLSTVYTVGLAAAGVVSSLGCSSEFQGLTSASSTPDGIRILAVSSVQTTDVSTRMVLPATQPGMVTAYTLPEAAGFMGLSGSITLDLDRPGAFAEELLEIGYARSCDPGTYRFTDETGFNAHIHGAVPMHALIAKATSTHSVLPVDYTLDSPVMIQGCFYVRRGADSWSPPTVGVPNVVATNSLTMRFVDAATAATMSNVTMNEGEGAGGEFCVGACDPAFTGPAPAKDITFLSTFKVTSSATLVSLIGSLSNAPFYADGRFAKVTGAWQTTDIVYIDPKCSSSTPGFAGAVPNNTQLPANAEVIYSVNLSGKGFNSVGQQFVNQPVNLPIHAGDCIDHMQWANSDSVIDMEMQLTGVLSAPAAAVASAPVATAVVAAAATTGIAYGAIADGASVGCDQFNPDTIKSLDATTISWLASIQPSGLTLHEQYYTARGLGYTGAFGGGQHIAYLAADPARQTAFTNAVTAFADQATPPYATRIDHHVARRAAGYQGLFMCGGDICYQAGQCDNLGRRL